MLEYKDRLDYGKSLMPDEGWKTSWAIGTTYSLDLDVLMVIPMALFHRELLSEDIKVETLHADLLDALDKVKERLFVFVQADNIKAETKFMPLLGFFDQNITGIRADNAFKNFHPKVWLVRYEREIQSQEEPDAFRYRLIVMSRNITRATDFDIAVSLDGEKTRKNQSQEALCAFLKELMSSNSGSLNNSDKVRREKIIRQFKKELQKVRFKAPEPFNYDDVLFFPSTFNFNQVEYSSPLMNCKDISTLLVISPFVDAAGLNELKNKCKRGCQQILISREEELNKIESEVLSGWECYQWSSILEQAANYEEDHDETQTTISRSISLHAKIYIMKTQMSKYYEDSNKRYYWLVGSMNCTKAGMSSNREASVMLKASTEKASPKTIFESLKRDNLIESYIAPKEVVTDSDKSKEQKIRRLVYDITGLPFQDTWQADPDNPGKYYLTLKLDSEVLKEFRTHNRDAKICISLPSKYDNQKWDLLMGDEEYRFPSLSLSEVVLFVKVMVEKNGISKEFLMRLPTPFDDAMTEERHGQIMGSILNTEEKIITYFMYCLDNNMNKKDQLIGYGTKNTLGDKGAQYSWSDPSIPIYEKLLLAKSRTPEALKLVSDNFKKIKEVSANSEDNKLIETFSDFLNLFYTEKPCTKRRSTRP